MYLCIKTAMPLLGFMINFMNAHIVAHFTSYESLPTILNLFIFKNQITEKPLKYKKTQTHISSENFQCRHLMDYQFFHFSQNQIILYRRFHFILSKNIWLHFTSD